MQIRLYADWAEVYYKGHLVERMERVRGEGEANVNYRHVIGSLVRKPGAFARYRFREQLFPTMHFRLTYDALREWRGERADVEYVRILHLAATTMEATVDSALSLLLEAGESFDYAEVRDLAEPKVPEAPALVLVWEAGPEDLRPPAHGQPGRSGGVRMMDTVIMQERIGQLCGQFKLPTMGAQSVARFTAAGHGDALSIFLEVLEQEAEDRRHRRINRLRQSSRLPSGKTWETPVFTRAGSSSTTGCLWRCGSSWTSWPRAASSSAASTSWPSDCPAPARPTRCAPWATAWWKLATPYSSHRPTAWCRACPCVGRGAAGRQARPGPAPPAAQAGQLRLPAPGRPGLPAPGRRGVRGPLHPHRRTLRTQVVGHHVKPGLLGVGTHLCQPHGHRRGD